LSNLRWGTFEQNMRDRKRHGFSHAGERNPMAKLTASDVRKIRRLVTAGLTHKEISKRFHVSSSRISYIRHRQNWNSVA
jgi:hypothetical protein